MINFSNIYEKLLYAHALIPYHLGNGRAFPPVRVHIDLTGRCNLKCNFCYQSDNYKHGENELDYQEIISIIDQVPKYSLITFYGGEPLLKKNIALILEHALKRHYCNIITNGVLLNKDIAELIVDHKLLLVGISIDAIGVLHDEIRGVKGIFDKIKANLLYLRDYKNKTGKKFPMIDVKTVLTNHNIRSLGGIYRFCNEIEADFFTPSLLKTTDIQFNGSIMYDDINDPVFYKTAAGYDYDVPLLIDEFKKLHALKGKTKIRYYPRFKDREAFFRHLNENRQTALSLAQPCLEPWSGILINASGIVYPCLSYSVGDVRKNTIREIWNSERYVAFRKKLRTRKLFPACDGCCYIKYN